MSMKRYAIVRNARTLREAGAYLPGNYEIVAERVERDGEWGGPAKPEATVFVIEGRDEAGWTLDGYVIPRYASGLIWAEEIDLSHPVMKTVPVEAPR